MPSAATAAAAGSGASSVSDQIVDQIDSSDSVKRASGSGGAPKRLRESASAFSRLCSHAASSSAGSGRDSR